ncbi:uncharacterized protein TNCV_1224341 [Trichonephila clavipes]|nr:uncharacterized protein TNCV_1224341 [Trichonephila clavipes]
MTNLCLKALNVVPCYYYQMLPTMWEALNTSSLSICRTMCELGHLLAHSISTVLSCCKPLDTYWFLNLGKEINVTGSDQIHCDIHSIAFFARGTAILIAKKAYRNCGSSFRESILTFDHLSILDTIMGSVDIQRMDLFGEENCTKFRHITECNRNVGRIKGSITQLLQEP